MRIRLLFVGFVMSIVGLLVACQFLPQQDCSVLLDMDVTGTIQDQHEQPISEAQIVIQSKNLTQCMNSEPMKDMILVSDLNGNFSGAIPIIAEDDILAVSVIVGSDRYLYADYVTYTYFDEPILIIVNIKQE